MTSMQIVALYTGLNLILMPILMYRVGLARQAAKISLGDGGDEKLLSRIRAHGNFSEQTPMALLGLLLISQLSAPLWLLHALGAGFTFGRVLHAHGMEQKGALGKGRVIGSILSLLIFLIMGAYLLYKAIAG